MRQHDAYWPPAPPGTRDAGAWFAVGVLMGEESKRLGAEEATRRRREHDPVWAGREIRQAYLDGYRMGAVDAEPDEVPMPAPAPETPQAGAQAAQGPRQGELAL